RLAAAKKKRTPPARTSSKATAASCSIGISGWWKRSERWSPLRGAGIRKPAPRVLSILALHNFGEQPGPPELVAVLFGRDILFCPSNAERHELRRARRAFEIAVGIHDKPVLTGVQ